MAHDMDTKFVNISFTAKDVKRVRPNWSDEKCLKGIEAMESHLKDELTEHGDMILDSWMDKEEPKFASE